MFISLTLYNCNRWIDDIKVEQAHQWPKHQQTRKNDSRQAYKYIILITQINGMEICTAVWITLMTRRNVLVGL